MKDKYVLDSSVWIALERNDKKILKIVEPLIKKNQVCLVDVIEAEVLRGAVSQKDFEKILDAFSCFTKLTANWSDVGRLAFNIAKKGFMPPLIDIYISTAVLANKKVLITQDKHFLHIKKVLSLQVVVIQ